MGGTVGQNMFFLYSFYYRLDRNSRAHRAYLQLHGTMKVGELLLDRFF